MKKITALFTLLLLCIGGAWATDVTVIHSTSDAATYGSFSGGTFTTNDASGLAGVTVSGIKGTTATNFAYGACLALTSTASGTITITAPTGYNITGYSLTARSNTYAVPYTLTPSAGGSAVTTSTTGVSLTATGLSSQSASFTYSAASANSFYIPALTVTVVSASAQLVNVTYNLYDVGDMVNIKATEVKTQEANSAINIPSSFVNATYFDYATEGTIGDVDCTISVIRTPKNGVVYPLSNLSNSKAYRLTTARGTLGTSGTQMVSTNGTSFSASNFAIISYEGTYYLWSVADSKWVSSNTQPTLTTNVGEAGKVVLNETTAPYYFMGMGSLGVNMASGYYVSGTNQFSGIVVNGYTTSDPGNQYIITEAADFDPTAALQALNDYYHPSYFVTYVVKDPNGNTLFTSAPQPTTLGTSITELPSQYQNTLFYSYNTVNLTIADANTEAVFTATPKSDAPIKFTADATTPVWYFLTMRPDNSAAYPTYVAGGTPNVTLPATNAQDNTTLWAFIGSPYGGFQIVNRAAGTSLVLGSANANGDGDTGGNTYATLAAPGSQDYEVWTVTASSAATNGFFISNAEGQYLNKRSTANLAYWTGGHDIGSTFIATEFLEGEALFNETIAELEAINFGTGVNQYGFTGSYAGYTSQAATIISGLKSQGYSANNLAIAQDLLANRALNLPEAGFYRIKGKTSGTYLAAGMASNSKFPMTTNVDATTIFYFNGTKLVNYSDGMVNKLTASKVNNVSVANNGWNWTVGYDDGADVAFLDGLTDGGYAINSETVYMYDNGDGTNSADRGGGMTINSGTNPRYTNWYLEPVTELPSELTNCKSYLGQAEDEYYTTLYMPVDVQISNGIEVYAVTGNEGNSLNAEDITGSVVPANTGVVLKYVPGTTDGGTTYAFTATIADGGSATSVLKGSVPAINRPGDDVFVLSVANGKLGFYKYEGNEMKGFRAYYENASADPTRGFVLNFGGTATGINAATLNSEGNTYDLQGRRVQNAQKGIFIINGKKVVK